MPVAKVLDYLLDEAHKDGGAKARFFLRFGFTQGEYPTLIEALMRHAEDHPVLDVELRPDGLMYGVEGQLRCPDGRAPRVRSVWLIRTFDPRPQLITAYPA